MDETFGQRLKRLRQAKGLSQRDLAEPGITFAYISRLEADKRNPSIKALRKLAPKLDVSVEYLETGTQTELGELEELRRRLEIVKEDQLINNTFYRYLFECGCLFDSISPLDDPVCPNHHMPDSKLHFKCYYDCGCYFRTVSMAPENCPIHNKPMGTWSMWGGYTPTEESIPVG